MVAIAVLLKAFPTIHNDATGLDIRQQSFQSAQNGGVIFGRPLSIGAVASALVHCGRSRTHVVVGWAMPTLL
jgi:hypothetical protein